MEPGWVYVLVNSSMPGIAKVGRTSRPPAERAAELSSTTGVPTPFVVAFDQTVADCQLAEKAVHDELDRRGLRLAGNREFFKGPASDIVRIVLEAAGGLAGPTLAGAASASMSRASARSLLATGDRYLTGAGGAFQDLDEALRCYKLAAARGSLLAFERLGRVYGDLYARRGDRAARQKGLSPLKEGARRGNYFCYAELAALFAAERHRANFTKAWDLFFAARAEGLVAEVETGTDRFATACCRYIEGCLGFGIMPAHIEELSQAAANLISVLLAELDIVRNKPADRQRVAAVLRVVYQALPPTLVAGGQTNPSHGGRCSLPCWQPHAVPA